MAIKKNLSETFSKIRSFERNPSQPHLFLSFNFNSVLFNFYHQLFRLCRSLDELWLQITELLLHDRYLGGSEVQLLQTCDVTLFECHYFLSFDVQEFLERHDEFKIWRWRDVISASKRIVKAVERRKMISCGWILLQLSVESNPRLHWFCFTSLCDWFRKLAPLP